MTSSGEITVELMQQILREVEKDSSIVVLPDLAVNELNENIHAGSCISRVTVKYTRAGEQSPDTLSLIVKAAPNSDIVDESSTIFLREIQIFDEILPRMSSLLAQKFTNFHKEFAPRGYYTRKNPSYLIALEDISPKGFKSPKRKNGLDLKHCILALKALARFHAASIIVRSEDDNLFTVFNERVSDENAVKEGVKELMNNLLFVIVKAIKSWPEFGPKWADRVGHRYQTLNDDLHILCKRDDAAFNVLNHGDFGLHNVMYRYSELNGEVEDIMLVDFQCCSYNSPVLDLHQFIFSSANYEVRANYIDTLLKEYHSELTTTMEALGAPLGKTISLERLMENFDDKMLYGFCYTFCALPILSVDLDSNTGFTSEDIFNFKPGETDKLQLLLNDSLVNTLKYSLQFFSKKNVL